MWLRSGGHVSPPTSPITEVDRFVSIPWRATIPDETEHPRTVLSTRNTSQGTSTLYIGSSCILTSYIFSWPPLIAYPLLQNPSWLQMSFEPRNDSRRAYQRMCRRIQHPYRLFSLNERMQRFRPMLPALQEIEIDQRPNVDIQERSSRFVIKRDRRIHNFHSQGRLSSRIPVNGEIGELEIIPPEEWARDPNRHARWQPDEPQIVITSDVQLQTDDNDFSNEVLNRRVSSEYITDSSESLLNHMSISSLSNNTYDDTMRLSSENTNMDHSFRESFTSSHSNIRPSSNVYLQVNVTDRATQTPFVLHENTVQEYEELNKIRSSDKIDCDLGVMSYKFYARTLTIPDLPESTTQSRRVANMLIKHARSNKTLDIKALHCLDCDLFPISPVTGQCGHTRCIKCIQVNGACPCGVEAPKSLNVNTVIQYLVGKMLPNCSTQRDSNPGRLADSNDMILANPKNEFEGSLRRAIRLSQFNRAISSKANTRMPMPPRVRFEHARRLLSRRRYRDAAPHLARVAASNEPLARAARVLLAQVIQVLAEQRDPCRITRDLFRAVRQQAASSWLRPADLECVLCFHTYVKPVTTPCGHTYCRTCIERALDYRKLCALCLRPLHDFNLSTNRENSFVVAALEAIDASKPPIPPDPNVIPIFVCTVAYPSIPCPLFIFDPRYWLMIRRVLESGSRKFGMVAYERDRNYSDYGTVLEVCDCVHLEDGRSFLSTVGVSRFKVIEREVRDGCDVARIQPLTDIAPTDDIVLLDMRLLGSQILYKALMWLNSMNQTVRSEIETAFGQIPKVDTAEEDWWESPDGPAWLWWLIAILPLRSEIKVLILSTKNLLKRMMAVSRTLEAIDQVAITTTATSECEIRSALTNAEEWLERGS